MAAKNSIKQYVDHAFYHVYNRGVDKRNIFENEKDFSTFLSYVKTYLLPKDELGLQNNILSNKTNSTEKDKARKLLHLKNFSEDIELHAYALLPNHFHFLIRQQSNAMQSFMNALGTRYSMYFNKKYKRIGVLFQDVYKAVLIESEEQLLQVSRYIHLNPSRWNKIIPSKWNESSYPCSLPEYLNLRTTTWINKEYVLNFFSKRHSNLSYENFLGFEPNYKLLSEIGIDFETD